MTFFITTIILAGFLSGLAMGMFGIGGGAILMPILVFAGLTMSQSVAIVLFAQIIPQSIPALISYYKGGHFLLKESIITVAGSFVGVTLGAFIATKNLISQRTLYKLMSLTLFILSIGVWIRFCM